MGSKAGSMFWPMAPGPDVLTSEDLNGMGESNKYIYSKTMSRFK